MKNILTFILLLFSGITLAQPDIQFQAAFRITNATVGLLDTVIISGSVDECAGKFTNSDIAIGDSIYVLEGSDLLIFGVVTTRTISLGVATFKAIDFSGAAILPSNGQAAIFRPTTNYQFPGDICGLNPNLQQYITARFMMRLDAFLSLKGDSLDVLQDSIVILFANDVEIARDTVRGGGGGSGSTELADGFTILGDGSIGNEFKVDTSEIATPYDLTVIADQAQTNLDDSTAVLRTDLIQDLSLTTNTLSLTGDPSTVSLAAYLDNTTVFSASSTASGSYTQTLGTTKQIWNGTGLSNLFVIDASNGRIGIGTSTPDHRLKIQVDGNSSQGIKLNNTTTGTAARVHFEMGNDIGTRFVRQVTGSAYTPSGIYVADMVLDNMTSLGGYFGGTSVNAGYHIFTGGLSTGSVRFQITGDGKVGFGDVFTVFGGPQAGVHTSYSNAVTTSTFEGHRHSFTSTGTAGVGFGAYVRTDLESSTGFNREAMRNALVWTDPTNGSEDAKQEVWLVKNGTMTKAITLFNTGFLQPVSGILDSDGDTGSTGQILTAKSNGNSNWATPAFAVNSGFVGDARRLTGLSMTAADETITSSSAMFTSADVGRTIIIYGTTNGTDGQNGDEGVFTIISFTSTTSVEASGAANTTVSGVGGVIGTDNLAVAEAGFIDGVVQMLPVSTTNCFLFSGQVDIDNVTSSGLVGTSDTLWFISANPNSYIGGSEPDKNLFDLLNCDNMVFRNFIAENIGQTQARPGLGATEGGYWTTLNGVSTPYNRHYNKQANHGAVINFQNSKNTGVEFVTSINTGVLVRAFGGGTPYENSNLIVKDCSVYGWGGSAVYPCDFSIVQNCYFDNSEAPVINSTDIGLDLGSSHVIYSASGYKNIKVVNNELRYCRGTAIQWNTSTGRTCENNIVNSNSFYECSRAGSLIGNQELLQVNLESNTYYKCGRWLIQAVEGNFNFVGESWDSTYSGNKDYEGAFNIGAAGSITISSSKFSRVTTTGNVAPIQATGHGLESDYNLTIDNCYFDSTLNRSFLFLVGDDSLTGQIVLQNNEFHAPVYIVGTAGAPTSVDGGGIDKFFIQDNNFYVRDDNAINVRLGATIKGNNFYQSDTDYGINVDLIPGSGYLDIKENSFFNRGGSNTLLLTSSTANDSVRFDQNRIYGANTITLNSNTLVSPSVNYFDGTLETNKLKLGSSGVSNRTELYSYDGVNPGTPSATSTNLSFFNYNTSTSGLASFVFSGSNLTPTSGTSTDVWLQRTFAPTSGTADYAAMTVLPVINQTGGANGQTYGIVVDPVLTAAADYVGIDVRNGDVIASGRIAATATTATLGAAATTLAITRNVVTVTGDAGANVLATITGGKSGQILTLIFVDALITITDDASGTANTVNINTAFVSTANDVLMLVHNGTSWRECGRSIN